MQESFNPCFLGTCPQSLQERQETQLQDCFNPCFLGTCPQRWQEASRAWWLGSFNPCFLGTCPQSRILGHAHIRCLWFQSLFSWNLPSESQSTSVGIGQGVVKFQSLFSWNLPSEGKWWPRWGSAENVSILVFLELALRVSWPCEMGESVYLVSILVFLELALRVVARVWRRIFLWVSILVFLELALRVTPGPKV